MKRIISYILILLSSTFLFAQAAHITDAHFDIIGAGGINLGTTKVKNLEMKYPVDTKTIFNTQEEFEIYINNYKTKLLSSRNFQSVEMDYKYTLDETSNIYNVEVFFTLTDSNHLIALPYPKYTTSNGLDIKIKCKDSNFLGTLNPLSADIFYNWTPKYDENNNLIKEETKNRIGINFNYTFPFKAGIFNAYWDNSLNYGFGFEDNEHSLSFASGILFTLPLNMLSINFGFSQGIELESSGLQIDEKTKLLFIEKFFFSTPVNLYKFKNFTELIYEPYIDFAYTWGFQDNELIVDDKQNIAINFGHAIKNENITVNDYFRKGYAFELRNDVSWLFQTGNINPSLSIEGKYFNNFKIHDGNWFNRFGISTRAKAFMAINFPSSFENTISIGTYVRGVLDGRQEVSNALIINFEMPFSVITTNFPWEIMNFNLQLSPFIDIAFTYDTQDGNLLNLKGGTYCAGMEMLINPVKFSSYTIRVSLGLDSKPIYQALRNHDNLVKAIKKSSELYLGLDLYF